jgi:hypothetical protein
MPDGYEGERPRTLPVDEGGERCGKFVAKDGERDLYYTLPKGHPETLPCSAPIDGEQLAG